MLILLALICESVDEQILDLAEVGVHSQVEGCVELAVCRYVWVGSCSQEDVDDLDPAVVGGISQHSVTFFILHID